MEKGHKGLLLWDLALHVGSQLSLGPLLHGQLPDLDADDVGGVQRKSGIELVAGS